MLRFVVTQNPSGKYSWTCYAKDGARLARSCQGYEVKVACMEAVSQVIDRLPKGAEVTVVEEEVDIVQPLRYMDPLMNFDHQAV